MFPSINTFQRNMYNNDKEESQLKGTVSSNKNTEIKSQSWGRCTSTFPEGNPAHRKPHQEAEFYFRNSKMTIITLLINSHSTLHIP